MKYTKKICTLLIFIFVVGICSFNIFAQDTKYLSEVRAEGYDEKGRLVWEGDVLTDTSSTTIEMNIPKNVIEVKIKPVASADCKILSISSLGQAYAQTDKIKVADSETNIVIKASLQTTGSTEKEYILKLIKREISTDASLKHFTYNLRSNDNAIASGLTDDIKDGEKNITIHIPYSASTIYFTTYIEDSSIKNKYINVKIYDSNDKLYEQINGISEVKYVFGQEKEAKFTVKTTAEDGITSKEYNVIVIKDKISNETGLGDVITVNTIGKDAEGYDKNLYTVNIDTKDNNGTFTAFIPDEELKAAKKFDLFVTVKIPTAKIQIVQNNKTIEKYDMESYYITTTDPIYINVTAEDGSKKQYTLNIVSSLFVPKDENTSNNPSNENTPSNNVNKNENNDFIVYLVLGIVIIVIIAVVAIILLRKKKQYSHMNLKDYINKK